MSDTSNQSSFLETTGFSIGSNDDVQRFAQNAVGDVRDSWQKARLTVTAVGDRICMTPSTDDDPSTIEVSWRGDSVEGGNGKAGPAGLIVTGTGRCTAAMISAG